MPGHLLLLQTFLAIQFNANETHSGEYGNIHLAKRIVKLESDIFPILLKTSGNVETLLAVKCLNLRDYGKIMRDDGEKSADFSRGKIATRATD